MISMLEPDSRSPTEVAGKVVTAAVVRPRGFERQLPRSDLEQGSGSPQDFGWIAASVGDRR